MSLARVWSPFFSSAVRMRGRGYFNDGRVRQVPPSNGELVRAEVAGQRTYTVTIEDDGQQCTAFCTCDHFQSGQYCKHIWATLIDVQENGPEGVSHETIEEMSPPRFPSAQARTTARARPRSEPTPSPEPRRPSWQDRLTLLRPSHVVDEIEPTALPQTIEPYYVLDAKRSNRSGTAIVHLFQRQPTRTGWGKLKRLRLEQAQRRELFTHEDGTLCALLVALGPAGALDGASAARQDSIYRLPADAQQLLIRQMIATGRCFVAHDPDHMTGLAETTPLTWIAGEPWTLWLTGDLESPERDATGDTSEADETSEDDLDLLGLDAAPTDAGATRRRQASANASEDTAAGITLTETAPADSHLSETEEMPTADGEPDAEQAASHTPPPHGDLVVQPELRRLGRRMKVTEPILILGGPGGFLVDGHEVYPFDDHGAMRWVRQFRGESTLREGTEPIRVAAGQIPQFLDRLYRMPELPELDLPEGIERNVQAVTPTPHLDLTTEGRTTGEARVSGVLWFDYAGHAVAATATGQFISRQIVGATGTTEDAATILIRRDYRAEHDAKRLLIELGFRVGRGETEQLRLPARQVVDAVEALTERGWVVHADQQRVQRASLPRLSITSGIDWFEMRGQVTFQTESGAQQVDLPEILRAARNGQAMITLDDGSQGLLPRDWLEQHGMLTAIGKVEGDALRFTQSQAALLDALLADHPEVDVDEQFEHARQQLRDFTGLEPAEPGPRFHGELRPYQKAGLGWLRFLVDFGFGGVLADDMGLGKTVQVLAHLDQLHSDAREAGQPLPPSLVVAPKSVVFNWMDEAERFTPHLNLAAYTGPTREQDVLSQFEDLDIIVTSYGLLRRDIEPLLEKQFTCAILDEAQAIKNPASQGAKAARLLDARYRLALTGTPVENHLGDLWSIFEFLNPGLLGASTRFDEAVKRSSQKAQDVDFARQVGRALRPFVLRRTKKQVLTELPDKIEQTIVCEMEDEQRKIYDELREHYRGTLLGGGNGATGPSGNQMIVLEALLRLRQAACHPALIDTTRTDAPSAKLDALLEQISELIDEGHKALVFSQFTSLLKLVRQRFDAAGIKYEYLDGSTVNRRQRVERFQKDPEVPVFLISLKAGGLGLNLTAASYVFLLDPWWNPAAEQQAIDRAHRIGQTEHVTAYRMVCHDTIEQRITELQQRKRDLAEAIIGGESSVLRNLSREDLDLLLK